MNHIYEYHKCKQCGRIYDWTNSHPHIFCSIACLRKWQAEHKKPDLPTLTKKCEYCGKEFTTRKSKMKYCSSECRKGVAKQKLRDAGKALHVIKTYICKNCGKEFTPEYGDKHRIYCSEACAKQYLNKMKLQKEKEKAC